MGRRKTMSDEKPLEEHTVKELREMAHSIKGIGGISTMKKAELINAITAAKDVPLAPVKEKSAQTISDIKQNIKMLKQEMVNLYKGSNKIMAGQIRKKIGKLKKKTRKMAGQLS
jgi:hypothetical protein